MALKDILVHVDDSGANGPRLDAAIGVAQDFEAHLTGLYVLPQLEIPAYIEADVGGELLETQRQAVRRQAESAEEHFRAATSRTEFSAEWRVADGLLASSLIRSARYTDLTVVGQANDEDPRSRNRGLADRVVMESGRPVLVVPYIGTGARIGERILVAWNAARESVRAVNDALPLLERAKQVEVLSINPSGGAGGEGDIPSADICLHLARHGVKTEARSIQAHDVEVGDMLLSRAADEGIDLMVMGAYGHSRFREFILGGATRYMLEHMTVPVFMSH